MRTTRGSLYLRASHWKASRMSHCVSMCSSSTSRRC
uniref:Pdc3 n=1 Tax=Arundo donax TaxID=35708 RepID=A0A0A9EG05_ARUDO